VPGRDKVNDRLRLRRDAESEEVVAVPETAGISHPDAQFLLICSRVVGSRRRGYVLNNSAKRRRKKTLENRETMSMRQRAEIGLLVRLGSTRGSIASHRARIASRENGRSRKLGARDRIGSKLHGVAHLRGLVNKIHHIGKFNRLLVFRAASRGVRPSNDCVVKA